MSNNAKLKKKAAEFEAKKNFEKALEIYEQVLLSRHAGDEDRDVALYNRVGDLHYRVGNTEQALAYYEQAADLYAEGGFFNNAIALCNKILRYAPGRTLTYYKLGIISAKKGFTSDAKQNFLEYADRMQRIGKMDEAFRALKEFADLCPGQDDVRLMLADQLARASRTEEALEQLEILYDTLLEEGRASEASATLERMKTLDPAFKPRRSVTPRKRQKQGLVFLDLDFDDAVPTPRGVGLAELSALEEKPGEEPEPKPALQPDPRPKLEEDADPSPAAVPEGFFDVSEIDGASGGGNELKFITPVEIPRAADNDDGEEEAAADDLPHIELAPLVDVPGEDHVTLEQSLHFEDIPVGSGSANGEPGRAPEEKSAEDAPRLAPDDDFIDLGEWLERNRTPVSTRMVAHDEEPEDDEQKDFAEMLDKFKSGISRNVDEEDFESHYDLGIAFREMGLLDEAIGSFQKALRGPQQRVRASEAIGQCFMDKGEAGVTMTLLQKLVKEPGMSDAHLVGVLYLLGRAAESLGRNAEAASYFERVLAVQIGFRDTALRLSALAG